MMNNETRTFSKLTNSVMSQTKCIHSLTHALTHLYFIMTLRTHCAQGRRNAILTVFSIYCSPLSAKTAHPVSRLPLTHLSRAIYSVSVIVLLRDIGVPCACEHLTVMAAFSDNDRLLLTR